MPFKTIEARKQYQAEYYKKNKQRIYAKTQAWRKANPDHVRQYERNRKNPIRERRKDLKRRYFGMTFTDYERMLREQNNVCAICKMPDNRKRRGKLTPLVVDHCTRVRKVRGLLCGTCNCGIGMLRHSITTLESAIEYLRKHN